ncbi:unnamed protein product [Phytophthora lilii]|uniref:Unnamed protein product n=1 Tax=Phytophthora lilii TaxID=2077276 RepID=A0A9W6TSF6_9STRA|nr:unnamed protein product [Phytophthora lilii]
MRLCCIVAFVFLVCISAASLSSTACTHAAPRVLKQRVTPTRFLRNYDASEEERGGFDKITGAFTKIIDKTKLQLKMQTGDDLGKIIEARRRHESGDGEPKLKNLMKYVDNYNKANPKKKMSAIGTLISKYGDDEVARALVRTTQSSKASAEAKEIAKMLQKEQMALWLHNGKTTYDVFKLLKLGEDGFSALGSSKFKVFESYIQLFNTKNSGQETLLTALKAGFKLATVLMLAKSDFASSAKATKVQTALFKDWLARKIDPACIRRCSS